MSIHLWSLFRWKSRPPLLLPNHPYPFRHAWLYFPPTTVPPASSTRTTADTSRRFTLCGACSAPTDYYILDMERTIFKLWSTRPSTLWRRCESQRQRCSCILDGEPRLATNAGGGLHQKQEKDSESKFWIHTAVTRVLTKFSGTNDSYTRSTFRLTSIVTFIYYYSVLHINIFWWFLSFWFIACFFFYPLACYLREQYVVQYLSFVLFSPPSEKNVLCIPNFLSRSSYILLHM